MARFVLGDRCRWASWIVEQWWQGFVSLRSRTCSVLFRESASGAKFCCMTQSLAGMFRWKDLWTLHDWGHRNEGHPIGSSGSKAVRGMLFSIFLSLHSITGVSISNPIFEKDKADWQTDWQTGSRPQLTSLDCFEYEVPGVLRVCWPCFVQITVLYFLYKIRSSLLRTLFWNAWNLLSQSANRVPVSRP